MRIEIREVNGVPCTTIDLDRGAQIVAGAGGIAAYPDGLAWYQHHGVFRVRSANEATADRYIAERVVWSWSYGLRGMTPTDPAVQAAVASSAVSVHGDAE